MRKYLNIILFGLLVVIGCEDAEEPDTTPPVVSIQSPLGGDEVSGVVSVQVNATDNDGLDKVELYSTANGLEGTSTLDATIHTFNWNSDAIENGQYGLYAVAYDDAGNSSTSQTIQVDVKNSITLTLTNQTHTDMAFQFGQGANPELEDLIQSGASYEIEVEKDRGVCTIQSFTTANYGLVMVWDFDITIGTEDIDQPLYYGSDYFFINMNNNSSYILNDFWVNRFFTTETHLELDMPNNNTWYPIGYFNAYSNSNVYFYTDNSSSYWYIDPITLSFENNQTYNINFDVSNSLSSVVGGTDEPVNGMLPTRVFEKPDGEIDFSIFD